MPLPLRLRRLLRPVRLLHLLRLPALVAILSALAAGAPRDLRAQAPQAAGADVAAPDAVADEFLRALQGLGWRAAAARVHPVRLDTFRIAVRGLVASRRPAPYLALLGAEDAEAFRAMDPPTVFVRTLGGMLEEAPGLVGALVSRRTEVVGWVPDGPDRAHVVYRVFPNLSNVDEEIAVMTLGRDGGRWKVLRANELDVLVTALWGLGGSG